MLNLRHKAQPQRIFRLQELNFTHKSVDYLGKNYTVVELLNLTCKGVGFSRIASFKPNEIEVSHRDNPGSMPLRGVNVYKWKISRNAVILFHCMAVFSKTPDGEGIGEIVGITEIGSFNSVDLLKDFAKRHKINLIN